MKNDAFLLVPLPLLRNLIHEPKTLQEMFELGIYHSAQHLNINKSSALKEFVYCLYRKRDELDYLLLVEFEEKMKRFPYDDNGSAFYKDTFNPKKEIEYLLDYAERHPKFDKGVDIWYRMRQMYALLNVKITSTQTTFVRCLHYESQYSIDKNSTVYFLINGNIMLYLYRRSEKTTADERALWAMYMGIISIIGKKDYAQTTSSFIKCRMFGARDNDELIDILDQNPVIKKMYDKYTSKYQYNKILNTLQDKDMVREIAHRRRTYVSFRAKDSLELMNMILAKDSVPLKKVRNLEKKVARDYYYVEIDRIGKRSQTGELGVVERFRNDEKSFRAEKEKMQKMVRLARRSLDEMDLPF